MGLAGIMIPVTSGLIDGLLLFLVASGLTLIFGVLRILNFAHGGFFMLGAYIGYTLMLGRSLGVFAFVALLVAAAAGVGLIGLVSERVVFRRLYGASETEALLGTYALLLILQGAAQVVWGVNPVSQGAPPSLAGALFLGQVIIPQYSILLVAVTVVVLFSLEAGLRMTRLGMHVRAVAFDRRMASALGIDGVRVSLATVVVGAVLAGLGGALAGPTQSLLPSLAGDFIIQAFAVVIIGGLGSIYGALIAALLAGILNSLAAAYAPGFAGYTLYALMVLVLILRPQGLFGAAMGSE